MPSPEIIPGVPIQMIRSCASGIACGFVQCRLLAIETHAAFASCTKYAAESALNQRIVQHITLQFVVVFFKMHKMFFHDHNQHNGGPAHKMKKAGTARC